MTWQAVLEQEFGAAEGSFLLILRSEYRWDRERFTELTRAMWECFLETQHLDAFPRWLGEGFWLACHEAPRIAAHPNFSRSEEPEYYERARELLDVLGTQFYSGTRMWEGEPPWV